MNVFKQCELIVFEKLLILEKLFHSNYGMKYLICSWEYAMEIWRAIPIFICQLTTYIHTQTNAWILVKIKKKDFLCGNEPSLKSNIS